VIERDRERSRHLAETPPLRFDGGVKGRFSEDRDRLDALVSRPVVAPSTLSADQREAAFIKLLAEAIALDIRRGGALQQEPLDELDEESAPISSEVRKVEEADDEP
jgi:hypothetical protein